MKQVYYYQRCFKQFYKSNVFLKRFKICFILVTCHSYATRYIYKKSSQHDKRLSSINQKEILTVKIPWLSLVIKFLKLSIETLSDSWFLVHCGESINLIALWSISIYSKWFFYNIQPVASFQVSSPLMCNGNQDNSFDEIC